jgi:hypothetical protein
VRSFEGTFDMVYGMLSNFHEVLRICLRDFHAHQNLLDYVRLINETYAVQLSYINWLETLQQHAKSSPELQSKFDQLCSNCVSWCLLCFKAEIPLSLASTASQLFKSICTVVRPANFFKYPNVGDVLANIHQVTINLNKPVKRNLYQATSSACLTILPQGTNISEEVSELRNMCS